MPTVFAKLLTTYHDVFRELTPQVTPVLLIDRKRRPEVVAGRLFINSRLGFQQQKKRFRARRTAASVSLTAILDQAAIAAAPSQKITEGSVTCRCSFFGRACTQDCVRHTVRN